MEVFRFIVIIDGVAKNDTVIKHWLKNALRNFSCPQNRNLDSMCMKKYSQI